MQRKTLSANRIVKPPLAMITFLSTLLFLICAVVGAARGETAGRARDRVLILGGGGPIGEAWESGVIAGVTEQGGDISHADRIIGTSAGAIVGARVASRMPSAEFIAAALAPIGGPPPGQRQDQTSSSSPPPDLSFLARKLEEMGAAKSRQSIRAQIGEWALNAIPVISETEFVASYQHRSPRKDWPGHAYECAAVDAKDGSLLVWNQSSAVPLAVAVASSCALPGIFAPVTINDHRYMDGGVRSVTNADLGRGCRTALVLAPTMGVADPLAKSFTRPLTSELQTLRDGGCKVELIAPDAASLSAFGATLGDEHNRSRAFQAGRLEGRNLAAEIVRLWSD
jgi:NTE family protein